MPTISLVHKFTADDLEMAEKIVRASLSNKDTYYNLLAENESWQNALKSLRKKEYAVILAKREAATERLSETASPEDYNEINRQFNKNLVNLTRQVLQEVGLPPLLQ